MRLLVVFIACALVVVSQPRPPLVTWTDPTIGMTFVYVPAGKFVMGSPDDEPMRESRERQHAVTLTHPYWLGQYEVTQDQWVKAIGTNPSHFAACGGRCPVERVNYHQIQEFISRLNAASPGERFRLPTEAEWEYACRAGTTTAFSTGATLTTNQANYNGNFPLTGSAAGMFRQSPTSVGTFAPNPWGLYDMHGNVWEWTEDPDCPYPDGAVTDPKATCHAEKNVIRGGSWTFGADSARCALRYNHRPQDLGFSLGFRLLREAR